MNNFKRIYQSLDNYDDFVNTYELSKEENFNENLIFIKLEESEVSHIEATHLQKQVNFLLTQKPSLQLTAMLIAQGLELEISPVKEDEQSIYLQAAMDGKNNCVMHQLLKYIDIRTIVDTLIKADKKEMLKDLPRNESFYVSLLANILRQYSQTINNSKQETYQDIDFYKSLMIKDFSLEILDTHLEKYLENIKNSINDITLSNISIITCEAPIEYVYDKLSASFSRKIYISYPLVGDDTYKKDAQLLYLSMNLEKELQIKMKSKFLKI